MYYNIHHSLNPLLLTHLYNEERTRFLTQIGSQRHNDATMWNILDFFLNVFTEFAEFSDKIFVITIKGLESLPTPGVGSIATRTLGWKF